jgi:cytochrome c556
MKTMISRSSLFILLFVLLLPAKMFAAEGKESPLQGQMEGINRSLRTLKRQYTDPAQKASSLTLVAAMQKNAEIARTLTPPKAAKGTAEQSAQYLAAFHNDLDKLLKEIAALKAAIVADKTDVAKAEIDKIGQLKDSSHKELGVEISGGRKGAGQRPPGQ